MMNVFEFLGLAPDYRKEGKVVQMVKNLEEVPESKIEYPLMGQIKYDGVYCMLVVSEDNIGTFGRTGKRLSNTVGLELEYANLKPGVYIGELCLPGTSLEVLSGIVNPNRTKPVEEELYTYYEDNKEMHFHDYLTIEEFISGRSDKKYIHRLSALIVHRLPYVDFILIDSPADLEDYAKSCIEAGHEGVVLKQDSGWEAGHKGWRSMKRVRRVEYDLLCVESEEGKGKYKGKVANLIFQWRDGDTIKAMLGKNYTHEDAESMFTGDFDPIGSIFTVYGLQDSSKGKIRLPKVGELRHDKHEPDF